MNQKEILISLIVFILGITAGFTLYSNYDYHTPEETNLFEDENIYEVNQTNEFKTIDFQNHSTGIMIDEENIYLDLQGDGDFSTRVDNLTRDGEEHRFVKNTVNNDRAYQLYYRYRIGEDIENNYLQLYRIREI